MKFDNWVGLTFWGLDLYWLGEAEIVWKSLKILKTYDFQRTNIFFWDFYENDVPFYNGISFLWSLPKWYMFPMNIFFIIS